MTQSESYSSLMKKNLSQPQKINAISQQPKWHDKINVRKLEEMCVANLMCNRHVWQWPVSCAMTISVY